MGYEKTNWKTGDVVTSEKLNNLENGVADAGDYIITVPLSDEDFSTIERGGAITVSSSEQFYQNIKTAYNAGRTLSVCLSLINIEGMDNPICEIYIPCFTILGMNQNNEKLPMVFEFIKTAIRHPNNNSNTSFAAATIRVTFNPSVDNDIHIISIPFTIEATPVENS